jgi:hypothetical protein
MRFLKHDRDAKFCADSAGRTWSGRLDEPGFADAACFTSTNELPKRITPPDGLLASCSRLYGIRPDGSDVRLEACVTSDYFGKRGAWSDISQR